MRRRLFRLALLGWVLWRLLAKELAPRAPGRQERPAGPTGRSVLVGRREYFVREAGPEGGEPLVLIHGWLYDGHATWHRVLPSLIEEHRVYVIDLRNHGKSDRVRSRMEISDLADDVERLLEALGLGAVPIVGYSLGGMVAQELALRHPGRVSRLVLGATAARPVDHAMWWTVPGLVVGRALSRIDRSLLPRLSHAYLMKTGVIPPEHSDWLWTILLDRDTELYYETGFAIVRFDVTQRIGAVRAPTLVIIPTDDQLIPARQQRETAQLIEGAQVVELVGAKHEAVLTHADDIGKAIRDFVEA
jgi:3-oxoadipate enol-lactonase